MLPVRFLTSNKIRFPHISAIGKSELKQIQCYLNTLGAFKSSALPSRPVSIFRHVAFFTNDCDCTNTLEQPKILVQLAALFDLFHKVAFTYWELNEKLKKHHNHDKAEGDCVCMCVCVFRTKETSKTTKKEKFRDTKLFHCIKHHTS